MLENAEVLEMGKVIAAVAWTAGGLWIGWTIGRMWFQVTGEEEESYREPESGWW